MDATSFSARLAGKCKTGTSLISSWHVFHSRFLFCVLMAHWSRGTVHLHLQCFVPCQPQLGRGLFRRRRECCAQVAHRRPECERAHRRRGEPPLFGLLSRIL